MFSAFKGYKTPNDQKLFENLSKDHIFISANVIEHAKQNNKTALYQIGECYYNLHTKIGYLKALDWYKKSSDAGSIIAKNRIGEMYHHGLGVQKDYKLALRYYYTAVEKGRNSAAYNNMGMMFYDGKGLAADHVKALSCFSFAAMRGFREAQYNLAWMYDNENSPIHDKIEAIKWYTKAAEQGHEEARKRIIQLNRMGIKYHPELDKSSVNKSPSGVQKDSANHNQEKNNMITIELNTTKTIVKDDVSLSTEQVEEIVKTNTSHANMVKFKREERLKDEKLQALGKPNEEALRKEKLWVERQLRFQREEKIELESKHREQEKAMRELQKKLERERLEREEEKRQEQEAVQSKLKALEKMIEEMKSQPGTLELPLEIPLELAEPLQVDQKVIQKPDEVIQKPEEISTNELRTQLPMAIDTQNRYSLTQSRKRQSKELEISNKEKTLLHCEKEEAVEEKEEAVDNEKTTALKETYELNNANDSDDCENDLCLDDSNEEEEGEDYKTDLYYSDSSEEE